MKTLFNPGAQDRLTPRATELERTERELRAMIARIVSASNKSKAEIAEEIGITESMLSDFAAQTKRGARFPIWFVAAFSEATGSKELRLNLAGEAIREDAELGRICREALSPESIRLLLTAWKRLRK